MSPINPIPSLPAVSRDCNIAALDRVSAILAGTATRGQIREHLRSLLPFAVEDRINDLIDLEEDDDTVECEHFGTPCSTGGPFQYVPFTPSLEVDLDGDEAKAWYLERTETFSGTKDGCSWEASVRKHRRRGRVLTLVVDVDGVE